jgi:hypothetical protein
MSINSAEELEQVKHEFGKKKLSDFGMKTKLI